MQEETYAKTDGGQKLENNEPRPTPGGLATTQVHDMMTGLILPESHCERTDPKTVSDVHPESWAARGGRHHLD